LSDVGHQSWLHLSRFAVFASRIPRKNPNILLAQAQKFSSLREEISSMPSFAFADSVSKKTSLAPRAAGIAFGDARPEASRRRVENLAFLPPRAKIFPSPRNGNQTREEYPGSI
jgi:hypothetical protein